MNFIISYIRKLLLISPIIILLILLGCSANYDIINIDAQGTINPIPIRIFENSKEGDLDITSSVTVNSRNKIKYTMKNDYLFGSEFRSKDVECSIKLPKKIINFDLDYKFSNRWNIFLGSQKYLLNNSTNNTHYFGFGYQRDFGNWGLRSDLFYYNHKHNYIANIVHYDETTEGEYNYDITDSLLYEDNSRYGNILTSITINFYRNNLFLNFSETPYFRDTIDTLKIGDNILHYDTIIYRRIQTVISAGYYKEINNLKIILGIAMLPALLPKNGNYFYKYFIQATLNIN